MGVSTSANDVFSILLAEKVICKSMIASLEQFATKWRISKFHAVLETKLTSEQVLADILAKHLKLPKARSLAVNDFNPKVFDALSIADAMRYQCLPLDFLEDDEGHLKVLFADPTCQEGISAIEKATGKKIMVVVATLGDIVDGISNFYPAEKQLEAIDKH